MIEIDWLVLSENTPPDEAAEVMDTLGNVGRAVATWYPFKVVKHPPYTKWSSKVEMCEPYWDGGWMIECDNSKGLGYSDIVGDIVKWRPINVHEPYTL